MAFGFSFGVALFLWVWSTARSDQIPEGVLHMECHDRYLMIAVDLSFTGMEPCFDAIVLHLYGNTATMTSSTTNFNILVQYDTDRTGVYAITEQYAAKCGYTVRVHPLLGLVEFRASYFSCHTDNKDDDVFTFKFNLHAHHERKKVTYALTKTCSPSLPWSPREVTCEMNYMEVSMRSTITCPSAKKRDDWNALKPVLSHSSTTSDWQVMFQRGGQQMPSINMSQARKQGYVFDLTNGRLVFRTPYGQPESYSTEVNGVPVEMVHATVFSRQRWMVLMVDLVAACSKHEGSYDDSGYVMWETPELLYPSVNSTRISVGLNGELVEQTVAEDKGYIVESDNNTILVSIPYNDDRGYRKSFVTGSLYEFYIFQLYFEQIFVDDDHVETMLRIHRTLVTPLLPCLVFTDNQTVLEERVFTVYLGNIPEDVTLASVQLNGQEFMVPFTNTSSYTITEAVQPNNTHSYTLTVPFDDPIVTQQVSKEDAVIHYRLDINYTLIVEFLNDPYYHLASIVALSPDVSPPAFDAVCSESGISFKLDHQPADYLWEISVGSDVLTSELAAQHGYIMSNDSQSLLLNVPLFTHGYKYTNVTLKGFFATFEILLRNRETSAVQTTVKTCPFISKELIMCSTDGRMTVVVDLSPAIPSGGGSPARTNLIDNKCGPKEADDSRAVFSFSFNSCGSTIKLGKENVTYQNAIFYNELVSGDAIEIMLVQCTYPLASLHRLFAMYRFESDTVGVGSIIHTTQSTAGLQSPTIKPTSTLQTTPATQAPARRPVTFLPAVHPPARYIKVSRIPNFASGISRKGLESFLQAKLNIVQV